MTPARERPSPPLLVAVALALLVAAALAGCTAAGRTATTAPGRPEAATVARPRWAPAVGTGWQWQLTVPVDLRVAVPVYDIDGFENGADVVRRLHALGRRAVCYVSVGSAENFRPDYRRFPASVLGRSNGWPGERWLDIRRVDVLRPIMAARFDMCRAKGFDAVEPDNVDGYANTTGFRISAAQQLAYNRLMAALAHQRGMSVALKNDLPQIPALEKDFDFAINEQCVEFGECRPLMAFIRHGKAVLHVEYRLSPAKFCPVTRPLRFSSVRKRLELDAWRQSC
ncbi:MAG TPA: endo alpha-1,4 polygalactosaminidase [Streptosporangiaceae bacterium]